MVNLAGLRHLVDAVGGVTLNVRHPILRAAAASFDRRYIEPGASGSTARTPCGSPGLAEGSDDYSRMARQKCVMNAMPSRSARRWR